MVTIIFMVQVSGNRRREQKILFPETSHPDDPLPQAEDRRELVINEDNQRFGIRDISMSVVET
jgi:hypothetical protein